MLPQTSLLLAAQAQAVDRASQAMLATVATAGLTAAQAVVVAPALITSATLAQAAMELTELLLSQPTSKNEIRYCRRAHKSCVESDPLGWRYPLHASRWYQPGKCHGCPV
jgi:hypothetical protein